MTRAAQDSQPEFRASEPLENQGPQEPEIDLTLLPDKFALEQLNQVTWKVTDGRMSNAWSGDRGGGHRTTRAVAWLIGIGAGMWVCRYRSKASRPMKLPAAKKYIIEMIQGIRSGTKIVDPIRRLHVLNVDAIEPMPTLAEVWAMETANYPPPTWPPKLTGATPDAREGDDSSLEYYEDGFPKLPACLDRGRKAPLEDAA